MRLEDVAKRYEVPVSRVRSWVKRGELAAVDVSRKAGSKRPRFVVTPDALADFERARSTGPAAVTKRGRGRTPQYV
jgi:transposase